MFKCSCEYFLLISDCLHKSVCVLDGDSHLRQIFVKHLVCDHVFCCLSETELHNSDAHLDLVRLKLLISAQLCCLLMVVSLASDFFHYLSENKLKLHCGKPVK